MVVEGLTWTISAEQPQVADLIEVVLSRVCSFITAASSEGEGKFCDAICSVQDGFQVEASSSSPDLSAAGLSGQL